MVNLNRNNSNWSFEERRKINENWAILESMANSTVSGNNGLKQEVDRLKITVGENTNRVTNSLQIGNQANQKADTAIATANASERKSNEARDVALGIDAKVNESNGIAQNALNVSNFAETKADNAVETANDSKEISENVRLQFNEVIAEAGSNNPEVVASRIDSETGEVFSSLSQRLDSQNNSVITRLNRNEREIEFLKSEKVFITEFGAIGDGVTDDTSALNAAISFAANNNRILVLPKPAVSYRVSRVAFPESLTVIGIDNPTIDIYFNTGVSVLPLLNFNNENFIKNIRFNCLESNKGFNRGDITSKRNVKIENCHFEGFRDASTAPNAWGIYIDKSENIEINNCSFENNSQSDIAIVEGCKNIKIFNVSGSRLYLNIEPNNSLLPIENVKILECIFFNITLLENDITGISARNISFDSCKIENLIYRGSYATFNNTIIARLVQGGGELNYAGSLNFNGAIKFGPNMIKDSKFNGIGQYWAVEYSPNSNVIARESYVSSNKNFLTLNPNNINTIIRLTSQMIPVESQKRYALSINCSAFYPQSGSNWIGYQMRVLYFDAEGASLGNQNVIINRSVSNTRTNFHEQTALINPMAGATNIKISVQNTRADAFATNSISISEIKLQEVSYSNSLKNEEIVENKNYLSAPPVFSAQTGQNNLHLKGTVIYNENTNLGNYEGWVCLASGNPGTWVGFNQLGLIKGPTSQRPNSGIYQGYQYLDTTLNANGRIITYNGTNWTDYTGSIV